MKNLFFSFFASLIFGHGETQRVFAVDTSLGRVKGKIVSIESTMAAVFLGIPYAEPPVFQLRFAVR